MATALAKSIPQRPGPAPCPPQREGVGNPEVVRRSGGCDCGAEKEGSNFLVRGGWAYPSPLPSCRLFYSPFLFGKKGDFMRPRKDNLPFHFRLPLSPPPLQPF